MDWKAFFFENLLPLCYNGTSEESFYYRSKVEVASDHNQKQPVDLMIAVRLFSEENYNIPT